MIKPRRRDSGRFRDQQITGFTAVLEQLRGRIPGAVGAALVDTLGETVDYAGEGEPFEFRVAAAHLQLLYTPSDRANPFVITTLCIRATTRTFFVHVLPEGYGLILVLRRRAFSVSRRAVAVAEEALRAEAGWEKFNSPWFPVRVETDARGAPRMLALRDARRAVTVLGRVAGTPRYERAYRVLIDETFEETTVICELGGVWYAERGFG